MALSEIHYVDEVAYARAVRRVVVIAENIQTGQPAARNAGDIGEQVVRNAVWIFTDES